MAFQPGLPGSQFPSDDALIRRIQDLEKAVQQLAAADPFKPMGIKPAAGGIIVNGSETVNGPLNVNGDSTYNGALSILGALTLKPGIIGNDALANPFSPSSAGFSTQNFSTTTSGAVYSQQTITVPAGFTQCMVMNGVSAGAWNNTSSGDYLYVAADINGSPGGETAQYASGPGFGSASAFAIRTLTGLTGGNTFTVGTRIRTGSAAWAANAATFANTNAIALFLR